MQEQKRLIYITRSKIVGLNFFSVIEKESSIIKNWETAGKHVHSEISLTACETEGDINEMFSVTPRNFVKKHCNYVSNVYVFNSQEDKEKFLNNKQL